MVYYGFSPGFIFSYLSTGQEIGWNKRLRYDLYCVEWDVKPQLNQFSSFRFHKFASWVHWRLVMWEIPRVCWSVSFTPGYERESLLLAVCAA